jgi:phosphoglycolate phosphatase-like HAD superfamily hydrolase
LAQAVADPLPSWNDTATKQAIVDFVGAVTDRQSKDFVPPAERIAVFDNDGTLWTEKPVYTHVFALLDRFKAQMAADPTLKERQPYKAIVAKDKEYFADLYENQAIDTLVDELVALPFGGMTVAEYANWNLNWLKSWKHPKFGVGVQGLIYRPMVELIRYLEANEFKVFIITADEGAFLRLVSQELYGLGPDRVYGTRVRTDYVADQGKADLIRSYRVEFLNNWAAKPRLIEQVVGTRPILAAGNSNGDEHMLQYTALQGHRSLALLVHHTDSEREFAYDKHADKVIARAAKENWTVVDMKLDWKRVFTK